MEFSTVSKSPTQFLALTSLKLEEFYLLEKHFAPLCDKFVREFTLEGRRRKHIRWQEHGNSILTGSRQKLFFLLVLLKTNNLQQQQAANFGVSQPKVSKIMKILLTLLNQALGKMKLLPFRDSEELATRLADHKTKNFSFDGTERVIQRNTEYDAQEAEYSGKKRGHRVKNNLLSDDIQYICYLSPTELGSVHDVSLANEYPLNLPEGSTLKLDLGFFGINQTGAEVEIGFKKPRNGELTFSQKLYNKMLSSTRIVIEHANSGVKRLKCLGDTVRVHCSKLRDDLMLAGCGLHNLRVMSEFRGYQNKPQ
jgi:DDE superfamily endonuclease/Helix-turn-helix of DDE superfamily endonuclease